MICDLQKLQSLVGVEVVHDDRKCVIDMVKVIDTGWWVYLRNGYRYYNIKLDKFLNDHKEFDVAAPTSDTLREELVRLREWLIGRHGTYIQDLTKELLYVDSMYKGNIKQIDHVLKTQE